MTSTNGSVVPDMGAYEYLNAAADSDGDGLTDGDETSIHGTSIINSNTDDDAANDYEEYVADTDPYNDPACFYKVQVELP